MIGLFGLLVGCGLLGPAPVTPSDVLQAAELPELPVPATGVRAGGFLGLGDDLVYLRFEVPSADLADAWLSRMGCSADNVDPNAMPIFSREKPEVPWLVTGPVAGSTRCVRLAVDHQMRVEARIEPLTDGRTAVQLYAVHTH